MKRALILGVLAAVFVGGLNYYHDCVIRSPWLTADFMPASVYGPLIAFILLINPLLARIRKSWMFSGRDIAIIMLATLLAGSVGSIGLSRQFSSSVMLPVYQLRKEPARLQEGVDKMVPQRLLPDVSQNQDVVVEGYVTGLGEGDEHIAPSAVPWSAWLRPLAFWMPMLATVCVIMICMALVVHKQWVHHEQIPFPIAGFLHSLLPDQKGRPLNKTLLSKLFWWGGGLVFLMHVNNYICWLWPGTLIPVQLKVDFSPLAELFPAIVRGGGARLFSGWINLTVVGLSYFVATSVAMSMGVMPFLFAFVTGIFAGYGVVFYTGNHLSPNRWSFLFAGSYVGFLTMILYTGRHYYCQLFKRGVGLRAQGDHEPYTVWAMRLLMVAVGVFVCLLVIAGMDWLIAIMYTMLALMTWLVVSRVVAETGVLGMGTHIFPGGLIWGVLGAVAIGPKVLAVVYQCTACLLGGPGWSPMPYVANGLKVLDLTGEKVSRVGKWLFLFALISLVISVPMAIYWQYDRGASSVVWSWSKALALFPGSNLVTLKQTLRAQGTLELAEGLTSFQRLLHVRPDWNVLCAFGATLSLTLLFGFCRLRFRKWPFHPVAFVFYLWGGGWVWSFLLGWFIKASISKYGGGKLYQRVKPLMVGLIAGDLTGRSIKGVVNTIFYLCTGHGPHG